MGILFIIKVKIIVLTTANIGTLEYCWVQIYRIKRAIV